MSDYSEFFFMSQANVVQLELLEIAHPNFSQTYRIVRNAVKGVTVTHEDASSRAYIYRPVAITYSGARDDLDNSIQVSLGDLGTIIPTELDNISAASGFGTKPTCAYRTYRSDDLTAPLFGPINYEIPKFSSNEKGSTFEAIAPQANLNRTGELFTLDRFPMLTGFL